MIVPRRDQVTQAPEPETSSSSGTSPVRRGTLVASAAVLASIVALSFAYERARPLAVLGAMLAAVVFVWAAGWLSQNRALAVALLLDVALIFAYLWSLDERVSVTIWATPRGYVARVGDNTATLSVRPKSGDIALFSSRVHGYLVQPGAGKYDPTSWLAPWSVLLRFAAPKPAWNDISVVGPGGVPVFSPLHHLATGWSFNRRGELEGDFTAPPLRVASPGTTYRFSAELMRGDGTQGVVVQEKGSHGYILLIRGDQNWAYWAPWTGHPGASIAWAGAGGHSPHFSLRLLPMIQKTLRFLLPSLILALTLLLLVIPCYVLVRFIIGSLLRVRSTTSQEYAMISALELPVASVPSDSRTWHGPSRLADLTALAIAAWGLLVAAYLSKDVLHAVPNVEDSIAFLFQAKIFALGRLWVPVPHLPQFFREEFLLMYHGHWFGKYTPGWPVLLAVGVKLGIDWLVNPVLLAGCLGLTYLIGKELYGRPVALLGTALAATSPFLLFFAGTFMAHTPTLFYFLASVYLVLLWYRREHVQDNGVQFTLQGWAFLVPAGFLLGMAAITRQLDTIGLALPFAVLFIRRPLALGWVGLAAVIPVAITLAFNKDLTGGFLTSPYALQYPWDRLGFGPTVGGPGTWNVDYTLAKGFWNLAYNIELVQVNLFGWPYYFALALPAIPFALGRARRWDLLLAASAAGLFIVYLAYYSPGDWFGFPRYTYGAIPWLALLAARGLQELYYLALRLPLGRPASRLAALAFPLLLGLGLIAYSWLVFMPKERTVIAGYSQFDDLAVAAVRQAHLHHAVVFQVQNPTDWWPYGGVVTENSPLLNGDVVYARDWGPNDRELMRLYPGWKYYRLNWWVLTPIHR